ncbi:solute carrier organic anion transporter family member 1B1-like [Oncorhynchus masou masou]|uniref:solute carrier organic anion transporter family member 1B1-like n=2 Tax=Oncorhynchus masou masou TaxID=90313 RepID=UPI00318442E3
MDLHQANRWRCCTVVAGETASSGQALTILQNKDQNFTEVNCVCSFTITAVHRGPVVRLLHQSSVRDLHEECHHSEKHFDLSSSLIGLIDGSFEMGNLLFLAVVSHLGAKLHRPRLIAMGCFLMAVGSFLTGLPHFFMGRTTPAPVSGASTSTTKGRVGSG